MIERHLDIATADGAMNSFVVHPEEGGPFPVVLFYMDAPGKREELHDMARRIAAVGYFVVLPNLYYRRIRDYFLKERTEAGMAEMFAHMATLDRHDHRARHAGAARLRRCRARGRRPAHRRGRLLHERADRDVGRGRLSRSGSPASPRSTAPTWRPTRPTRRTAWRRRSAARATSPAPRSTSGRRRPTSTSCEAALRDAGTPHRIEWYPGAEHGFVFPSASASTTGRRRAALGAPVRAVRPHASTRARLTLQADGAGATRQLRPLAQEHAMTGLKPAAELAAAASQALSQRQRRVPARAHRAARRGDRAAAPHRARRRAAPRPAARRRGARLRLQGRERQDRDLADLFGRHDTLVTYFWMYGPQRERPCPMCTSFLGSIDIPARDISQRVAIAVIGRSPVERQLAFARERGWKHLKFYATVGDDFARDYRGLAPDGSEWPALDVWVRRDGKVLPLLGRRARRHQRSRPGPARRARPDAALEPARPHAGRARRRLVSEARLSERRLRSRRAESPTTQPGAAR